MSVMTFTLGIFDLYTYFVPGAAMTAFLGYLGVRLEIVEASDVMSAPGFLLAVAAAVVSFVLGHLLYAACRIVDPTALLAWWDRNDARQQFLQRVPHASGRPFVAADAFLLLSAVEVHDREASILISQVRAQALMLRSLVIPVLLAFAASIAELVAGSHGLAAGSACLLTAVAAVLAAWQSRVMRRWAHSKTLELCYWLPTVDGTLSRTEDQARTAD
jgi:hypothetical protein